MDALAKVRYPGTGKDLVEMGMVEDNIRIEGNKVSFSLLFEKPNDPFIKSVVKAAETAKETSKFWHARPHAPNRTNCFRRLKISSPYLPVKEA